MERTLYLSERQGLRINRDGPSLWVRAPGQAGRRVPARLIRRVLVMGHVALDAGCLTLFAERGVPVTLLNRRGEAVATVLGLAEGEPQRQARQAALLEDRPRLDRVLTWMAAWERGRQLVLARRVDPARAAQWRSEGLRRADYEAWVTAAARTRGVSSGEREFFRSAVYALVVAEVTAAGFDPHKGVLETAGPLAFAKDCALVFRPEADRFCVEPGTAASDVLPGGNAGLARRFESGRPHIEALVRRFLAQFAELLWRG